MRYLRIVLILVLPLFVGKIADVHAQMSYSDTKDAIERIRERSEFFEEAFRDDVDDTGVDSDVRDGIERTVSRFEDTAEVLDDQHSEDNSAASLVRELLRQASSIDSFVLQHHVSPRVQSQWGAMRPDLDRLARSYNYTEFWPSALARAETRASEAPAVVIVPAPSGAQQMKDLIQDIQISADAYHANIMSMRMADETTRGVMNQYVNDFRVSVARLNAAETAGSLTADQVREAVSRAEPIDRFMKTHPVPLSSQESWMRVRTNLARLAAAFNVFPLWLR